MENNNNLDKILDTMNSVTKVAANLSESKKPSVAKISVPHQSDDSNSATTGNQSVNLVLDTGKKKEPKPVEKHIHTFPENRPLTEQECALDLKKAQMEYDLKKAEQQYEAKIEDRNWNHKLELEKKAERRGKIRRIIGGILIAVGAGATGYAIYSDYRDHKNQTAPQKLPEPPKAEVVEGEVK